MRGRKELPKLFATNRVDTSDASNSRHTPLPRLIRPRIDPTMAAAAAARAYDLVVWGGSGFTGRLAAEVPFWEPGTRNGYHMISFGWTVGELVRRASGTRVPDTTSGFRAYNREAALQLLVVSRYTYTLESLIQAGKMQVAIEDVPISPNRTASRSIISASLTSNFPR